MKGIKHSAYNSNWVEMLGKKWDTYKDFKPFFYAKASKLTLKNALDSRVEIGDEIIKKNFWTNKEIAVRKVTVPFPVLVPTIARSNTFPVFQTDIPYLQNYLLNSKTKIYENEKYLKVLVFDTETVEGKTVLIGYAAGLFNLETLTYESKTLDYFSILNEDIMDILIKFLKICQRADLIVAHNMNFDWSQFVKEAQKYGIKVPFIKHRVYQHKFHGLVVTGPVNMFDTVFAASIGLQSYPNLKLKELVRYLHLGDPKRVMVTAIDKTWKQDPKKVTQYCLDDVTDCLALFKYFAPVSFVPCIQAGIPVTWFLTSGFKSVWDFMLSRHCIDNNYIIPHFAGKSILEGEYANPRAFAEQVFKGGFTIHPKRTNHLYDDVYNVDLSSAYPNAILQKNISPETVSESTEGESIEFKEETSFVKVSDKKGALPKILKPIVDSTIELKERSKTNKDLKPLYQGYKMFRNSAFGFMSIKLGQSRFKNIFASALVTQTTRDVVIKLQDKVSKDSDIIYGDTDGLYFVPNKKVDSSYLLKTLTNYLINTFGNRYGKDVGTGLDLAFFPKMYFFGHKNYIALDKDLNLFLRGVNLTSRSIPKLVRDKINRILKQLLLTNQKSAYHELQICTHEIKNSNDPDSFQFNISIKKDYVSSQYKHLSDKFGEGIHSFYVKKYAPKQAKPYTHYELIDRFKIKDVDIGWYVYCLNSSLTRLGLNLSQSTLSDWTGDGNK